MKTVALDQNKWIEIAIAWANQDVDPYQREKLFGLVELARLGKARFPLTFSNIYETWKVFDPKRRADLAFVQAVLSQGKVFVGRHQQRKKEIADVLRSYFGLPQSCEEPDWYLSNRFWEAVESTDEMLDAVNFSPRFLDFVDSDPIGALLSFLTTAEDGIREASVRHLTETIATNLFRIEQRRLHHREHSLSIRRRALSVYMFMENQDHFWKVVDELGLSTEQFRRSDASLKKELIRSVPSLFIERELALKIESESATLVENDVRDMLFMSTSLPYADIVVGERPFVQRARQAGLHEKYSTLISSELSDLTKFCST